MRMKSNRKIKTLILTLLGILFVFLPIFTSNLNFKNSELSLDNEDLKVSKISGKIHIDDTNPTMNWSVAKKDGICTGNGTYSEPYVIEDLVINGGGSGDCILIENSDVYFRIENCTVYNSAIYPVIEQPWNHFAGIRLKSVNNSLLLDNDCSSNNDGIHVGGFNNTIAGNIANNNNNGSGIFVDGFKNTVTGNTANNNNGLAGILLGGYNNTVSGNIAVNNSGWVDGIILTNSNYNNILGNNASIQLIWSDHNNVSGNNATTIGLFLSDYNTISGNIASVGIGLEDSDYNIVSGNDACWVEIGDDCDGNAFSDNNGPCPPHKGDEIPIELIILISVFSGGAVIVVATFLLIRRKRKRKE